MVWHLTMPEHQVFNRNPLVATVIELRFHPILKISSGQGIPEFQGLLREKFPLFTEVKNQVLKVEFPGSIETREEKQYQLKSEDESTTITLGGTSLIIETRNHESHIQTLDNVDLALNTLRDIYAPVKSVRLGMRYINIIDRFKISEDLGESRVCSWEQLVIKDYLNMPAGIADLSETNYTMEVTSPIDTGGGLSLRYGLQPQQGNKEPIFRFDIDRFSTEHFEVEAARKLLDTFAHDIFALYMTMVGERLKAWMEPVTSSNV